jgi:1,2-diacylglycerol 3-alpha-glucosyltransferase
MVLLDLAPYQGARALSLASETTLCVVIGAPAAKSPGYLQASAPPGLDCRFLPRAGQAQALRAILSDFQPDAVLIPGWSSALAWQALSWAWGRCPIIWMSETHQGVVARRPWSEALKARLLRGGQAALVGGSPQKRYMEILGFPRGNVALGHNAVDNKHFSTGAALARRRSLQTRKALGLPPKYWFACGRLVPEKDPLGLLEAYAVYAHDLGARAWPLVWAGDGDMAPELRARAKALGIERSVIFKGRLAYGQLPAHYALAQALVHAPRSEAWGLVVNEALACGLPVLATKETGCAQDLLSEGAGWIVEGDGAGSLARAMERVHRDAGARRRAGRLARMTADAWGPSRFSRGALEAVAAAKGAGLPRRWPAAALIGLLSTWRHD